MKSYGFASAAATVLAGAALISTVKAEVDPIVIKVRISSSLLPEHKRMG